MAGRGAATLKPGGGRRGSPGTHRQAGEALPLAQDVQVLAQVPQVPAQGGAVPADLPQLPRQLLRLLLHPQRLAGQRRRGVFGARPQLPPGPSQLLLQEGCKKSGGR